MYDFKFDEKLVADRDIKSRCNLHILKKGVICTVVGSSIDSIDVREIGSEEEITIGVGDFPALRRPNEEKSALDTQVGGDHYKKYPIQPMEYSMKNKLDYCQSSVVKYITRYKDKGGINDLEKAKHCIDYLIELESVK